MNEIATETTPTWDKITGKFGVDVSEESRVKVIDTMNRLKLQDLSITKDEAVNLIYFADELTCLEKIILAVNIGELKQAQNASKSMNGMMKHIPEIMERVKSAMDGERIVDESDLKGLSK